jgi:hypothetical protein
LQENTSDFSVIFLDNGETKDWTRQRHYFRPGNGGSSFTKFAVANCIVREFSLCVDSITLHVLLSDSLSISVVMPDRQWNIFYLVCSVNCSE